MIYNPENETHIFLFPHQDDEFGVFFCIEESLKNNVNVICIYCTDGTDSTGLRNSESVKVLTSLGVDKRKIFFFSIV